MKRPTPEPNPAKCFSGKGVFPHQYAFTLLFPLRNIFLSPKQLINRLELQDDFTVMELGPGPGYFSSYVAKQIPKGKLVLVDIQQEMLEYARKRLHRKGLENVEYHLCDGENFLFENELFDRIYMVTVIGEVQNRDSYLREFHRMLKPGGMLSISESAGDPDKMSVEEVRDLCEANHFTFDKLYGNKRNYTINFRKPDFIKSE